MYYLCTNIQTNVIKAMENTTPLRQKVKQLEVGESLTLTMQEVGYTTLRSYASELGLQFQRKYSTRHNRENRTVTITRNS